MGLLWLPWRTALLCLAPALLPVATAVQLEQVRRAVHRGGKCANLPVLVVGIPF